MVKIQSILNELNLMVVTIDGDDHDSLKDFKAKVQSANRKIKKDEFPAVKESLSNISKRLGSILKGTVTDNKYEVKLILSEFKALERIASGGGQESKIEEARKSNVSNQFELPEWVDDDLFHTFLADLKPNLEEFEADILAVDADKPDTILSVKRRLHSLKGESGVMGLDDLSQVCHVVEDLLDSAQVDSSLIDLLLGIKDWIAGAAESYENMQIPNIPKELLTSPPQGEANDNNQQIPDVATNNEQERENSINQEQHDESQQQQEAQTEITDIPEQDSDPQPDHVEYTPWGDKLPEGVKLEDFDLPDIDLDLLHAPIAVDQDEENLVLCEEFCQESEEGLNKADNVLLNIERDGTSEETVNELFRVFHTIKGVSSFLDLHGVAYLAHTTETLLNAVRKSQFELSDCRLDVVFDATDTMRKLIELVRTAMASGESHPTDDGLEDLIIKIQRALIFPCEDYQTTDEAIQAAASGTGKLGEILEKSGVIDQQALDAALQIQDQHNKPLGEILIEQGHVKPKEVANAIRSQQIANKNRETIKVGIDRIDRLVETIGELVIVESMVMNANDIINLPSLQVRNYLNQLSKITRDLQDLGMRMRMVEVRGVFQKMARLVRDLSHKSGKKVRMEQTGQGTEVDRSIVELLADPLIHMIRNAVDHGIEDTIEDRRAAGKPDIGTIYLNAYHEGGTIVIEVVDDGKGLNRKAIIEKALSQGIIKEETQLTDEEIDNLIFSAGFSTAKTVTEISGRGVGMDVVRKNIESLRGRVSISSADGEGTTFKMILPLTLAIIDGMQVACGEEIYIIPTLSIIESFKPDPHMLLTYADKHEMINLRGKIIPLFRLDRLFEVSGALQDPTSALVVVVESQGRHVGILVDDVVTQQQVVIKKVGAGLEKIEYISGAAILSDGSVGLIINIEELSNIIDRAMHAEIVDSLVQEIQESHVTIENETQSIEEKDKPAEQGATDE